VPSPGEILSMVRPMVQIYGDYEEENEAMGKRERLLIYSLYRYYADGSDRKRISIKRDKLVRMGFTDNPITIRVQSNVAKQRKHMTWLN